MHHAVSFWKQILINFASRIAPQLRVLHAAPLPEGMSADAPALRAAVMITRETQSPEDSSVLISFIMPGRAAMIRSDDLLWGEVARTDTKCLSPAAQSPPEHHCGNIPLQICLFYSVSLKNKIKYHLFRV